MIVLKPIMIQKCSAKCVFTVRLREDEDDPKVDNNLEAFAQNQCVTWEEYAEFDAEISTN